MVARTTWIWIGAGIAVLVVVALVAAVAVLANKDAAPKPPPPPGECEECEECPPPEPQHHRTGNIVVTGREHPAALDLGTIAFDPPFATDNVGVVATVVQSRWNRCSGDDGSCGTLGCWLDSPDGNACSEAADNPYQPDNFGVEMRNIDRYGAHVFVTNNHSGWSAGLNIRWVATEGKGLVLAPGAVQ